MGTLLSLADANEFVNRTFEDNTSAVDRVAAGDADEAVFNKRFGYPTGKEAFRPAPDADPHIRKTYNVRVVIRHAAGKPRGYLVGAHRKIFTQIRDAAREIRQEQATR